VYLLNSKYHQKVYYEAYGELVNLLDSSTLGKGFDLSLSPCGAAAFTLSAMKLISITPMVPEQLVMINKELLSGETHSHILEEFEEIKNSGCKRKRPPSPIEEMEEPAAKVVRSEMDQNVNDFIPTKYSLHVLREIASRNMEWNATGRRPMDIVTVTTSKLVCSPTENSLVKEFGHIGLSKSKTILQDVKR